MKTFYISSLMTTSYRHTNHQTRLSHITFFACKTISHSTKGWMPQHRIEWYNWRKLNIWKVNIYWQSTDGSTAILTRPIQKQVIDTWMMFHQPNRINTSLNLYQVSFLYKLVLGSGWITRWSLFQRKKGFFIAMQKEIVLRATRHF